MAGGEAACAEELFEVRSKDAALNAYRSRDRVEGDDLVEAREVESDGARRRRGTPDHARSTALGGDRNARIIGGAQGRCDLSRGARSNHHARPTLHVTTRDVRDGTWPPVARVVGALRSRRAEGDAGVRQRVEEGLWRGGRRAQRDVGVLVGHRGSAHGD